MILKPNSILLFNVYVTDPYRSNLNFHMPFRFKHFVDFRQFIRFLTFSYFSMLNNST